MPKKQELKMSDLNLRKIKEISLTLFKDNAPDPRKAEHFLTECWIEAIVGELNRQGFTDLIVRKDHESLIKD